MRNLRELDQGWDIRLVGPEFRNRLILIIPSVQICGNFFIITNLIYKFLIHSHKLHKIKFLYMFRAQSAHHQEVNDADCTYAVSGIVTLCK